IETFFRGIPTPTIGGPPPKLLPFALLLAPGPFVPVGVTPTPPGVDTPVLLFENPKPLPDEPVPELPKPLGPLFEPLFEKPKLELPLFGVLFGMPVEAPLAAPSAAPPFAPAFVPDVFPSLLGA